MLYDQKSSFLYCSHLPLTALYYYHGAIQLGTVTKHYMNIVLFLDGPKIWRITIRQRLQCSNYWQLKAEDQWSQFLGTEYSVSIASLCLHQWLWKPRYNNYDYCMFHILLRKCVMQHKVGVFLETQSTFLLKKITLQKFPLQICFRCWIHQCSHLSLYSMRFQLGSVHFSFQHESVILFLMIDW